MYISTSWLHTRRRTWSLYLLYVLVINEVQVKLLFMWIIQGLTIDLTPDFRAWVARLHRTTVKQLGFSSVNFMVPCFLCHTCQICYRLLQYWIKVQVLMSYTRSAAHSFLTAMRVFTVVTLALLAAVGTINITTFMVICFQFQNKRKYLLWIYSQKWEVDPKGPTELEWQTPIAVYTVLRYSWWWTVDLSETCRVLYQINLRNCASLWLLLQELF